MCLHQGKFRVPDYAIELHTLAADSGWSKFAFLHGMINCLKDQLASLDLPAELDSLIAQSIKIDKRLNPMLMFPDHHAETLSFHLFKAPNTH